MDLLTRSGCFEVAKTKAIKHEFGTVSTSHLEKAVSKQAKLLFAIEYLQKLNEEAKERNIEYKSLKGLDLNPEYQILNLLELKTSSVRTELTYDDYYDLSAKEYEIISSVEALEKLSFTRQELKSQINKINMFIKNLMPYVNCDIKFSRLSDTKTTSTLLVLGQGKILGIEEKIICSQKYKSDAGELVAIICKKDDKQEVTEKLNTLGYSACSYNFDKTASELIKENNELKSSLQVKLDATLSQGLKFGVHYEKYKALYDIVGLDVEKSTAELDFVKTDSTFVVEGFTPASTYESIKSKLEETTKKIIVDSCEVTAEDEPPTLMNSSKLIRPFESITNNYSPPAYGELDPNPTMAFFFFIFFGIMLGDAGYGLILSLACMIVCTFFKLETGTKRTVAMFGICGISGIIFGLVFGGVFALDSVTALWFNPLEEPLTMLIFSLILGVVHLLMGYTMKMIKGFKARRPIDGILSAIFMYSLFGGIACLLLPSVIGETTIPFGDIAVWLLVGSLVGILLTNGRNAKSIGGKIAGGLSGLYDLINLFSDVLSYSRLFGLALSSAAIGMAFNMIGAMVFEIPLVGVPIGILVLVLLHAFNFALSFLSAYVHNIRLQYLEYYGKFYDGDGRLFAPLGENTQYVRFTEKKVKLKKCKS